MCAPDRMSEEQGTRITRNKEQGIPVRSGPRTGRGGAGRRADPIPLIAVGERGRERETERERDRETDRRRERDRGHLYVFHIEEVALDCNGDHRFLRCARLPGWGAGGAGDRIWMDVWGPRALITSPSSELTWASLLEIQAIP